MTAAELIAVRRAMFASFERAVRDLAILTPAEELNDMFARLETKIDEIRSVTGSQSKGEE
jgi:hypothetical protein